MTRLSIIVPCYNEQDNIPAFFDAACAVLDRLPEVEPEYIFVDDGSRDNTILLLRELAAAHPQVRYLSFSRNFGKEAAMYAGLQHASGDLVAVMDADLQDPPDLLPEMLRLMDGGEYDCVAVRRVSRKGEPPVRSFFARLFYKLINKLSRTEIPDGARDFRLMTRQMVDSVLSVTEYNRFSKGIFSWVGYRTCWLETDHAARSGGRSKWSFLKLCAYALDGIIAFSAAPLAIASILGVALCGVSFVGILVVIIRQLVWGGSAYGWPSLVCIILLIAGIQLFCIGILGQYISKVYLEVKDRPIYILRESGGGIEHDDKPDRREA